MCAEDARRRRRRRFTADGVCKRYAASKTYRLTLARAFRKLDRYGPINKEIGRVRRVGDTNLPRKIQTGQMNRMQGQGVISFLCVLLIRNV